MHDRLLPCINFVVEKPIIRPKRQKDRNIHSGLPYVPPDSSLPSLHRHGLIPRRHPLPREPGHGFLDHVPLQGVGPGGRWGLEGRGEGEALAGGDGLGEGGPEALIDDDAGPAVPVVKGHPIFPSCGHRKLPTRHMSAGGYARASVPLRRPALIFSLSR